MIVGAPRRGDVVAAPEHDDAPLHLQPTGDHGLEVPEAVIWRELLWSRVFLARHAGVVALALAAALVPAIGPHRLWIAAAMVTLVLPYEVGLHLLWRRTRRLPTALVWSSPFLAAAFTAVEPRTFVATLIVAISDLALTAVAFGRRQAVGSLAVAVAGMSVAVIVSQPPQGIVGVFGLAISGTVVVLTVTSVVALERILRQRYAELVAGLDAVVWESDPGSASIRWISGRAESLLGYSAADWVDDPEFWPRHLHPVDRDAVIAYCLQSEEEGRDHELEYRMVRADGTTAWVHDVVRIERDRHGRPVRVRGLMVDVTTRRQAEEGVRQFADIVENIAVGLFVVRLDDRDDDRSLRIVAVNPEAGRLLRRDPADLVGRLVVEAFPSLVKTVLPRRLAGVVRTHRAFAVEWPVDQERLFSVRAFPLPGDAVGVSLDDVTAATRSAELLRHQATHDDLTGLPNRVLLLDRLQQALVTANREGSAVALLVMDLDAFKEVNDALGHHHGDRLLVALSRRLEDVLRECDTIARLGGDEFAVLLTTDVSRAGAEVVARKITNALEQPFSIDGLRLQSSASIGIAHYPEHADHADELVQRADVAMYLAKRSGWDFATYAAEQDKSSVRRLTLLGELRRALTDEELTLHFQPLVDLRSGRVVRAEALVRWEHPRDGLVAPGDFIELAELSGLIQPLTRWVIERAVQECCRWAGEGFDLGVAVNLSVRNLYEPELAPWLARLLRRTGLPTGRLTLEITESHLMDDPLLALSVLREVSELGVASSVDDFGTGYSSLSYLKHLPLDEIKIDRSFVATMSSDESDATIVRSIIDLGHNLGLRVVAEGVEDEVALRRLTELGCDRAQGFLLGAPRPGAEFLADLRAREQEAAEATEATVGHAGARAPELR
ncbi:MAG TPA: EAL domain-containing protein [Acidimicrobiales bacterium]